MRRLLVILLASSAACGDDVPSFPLAASGVDAGPLRGEDGGAAERDAGAPDGGATGPDASAAGPDASAGPTDAGLGSADAGPLGDAGLEDAGLAPADAGPGDSVPHPNNPFHGTPDAVTDATTCSGKGVEQAHATWELSLGPLNTRRFDVHLPPIYDPAVALPLVVNFHGLGSNAGQQEILTQMNAKADEEGFIAVHPHGALGTTFVPAWNAGTVCCSLADDVGFVRAMLDELFARLCIDPRRVYATGFSNGGMFSNRLGCEVADRFAAIAPVAGVNLMGGACTPSRPVPALHIHGSADATVPYDGGYGGQLPSAHDSIEGWATRAGCADAPTEIWREGNSHCEEWLGCVPGVRVVLCTVDGLGHLWPRGFGDPYSNLDATAAIWDFFKSHRLP